MDAMSRQPIKNSNSKNPVQSLRAKGKKKKAEDNKVFVLEDQYKHPKEILLSIPEAAQYLRKTVMTVRAWIDKGKLPFVIFGPAKRKYLRLTDLEKIING